MSRLIQIDPEAKLNPEPEGYEFGYHTFEDMEPIKSDIQEIRVSTEKEPITLPQEEIKLPLSDEKLLLCRQEINSAMILVTNCSKDSYKIRTPIIKKMKCSKDM